MAQAFGNRVPVTIEYKLDVSQAVAAFEAIAKQCADAAEALRKLAAEQDEAPEDSTPEPPARDLLREAWTERKAGA
jgi:hypothetical protein